MRSKLSTITIGWYKTATFDLIRHAKRRDTFPSRGRLFSVPAGFCVDFCRSNIVNWRIGACRRPYNAPPEVHFLRKKARGEHLGPPRVGSQDQDTAEATAFGTGLQPVHKRHTGGGMALQIPPDPEGPEADELQKYL